MDPDNVKEDYAQMMRLARFAGKVKALRKQFPEYALQIDRLLFDTGQTLRRCNEPGCDCQVNFEQFHEAMNRSMSE